MLFPSEHVSPQEAVTLGAASEGKHVLRLALRKPELGFTQGPEPPAGRCAVATAVAELASLRQPSRACRGCCQGFSSETLAL